jgi:hypothetical protein
MADSVGNKFNSLIDIRLPLTPEQVSEESYPEFLRIYNAIRQLQAALSSGGDSSIGQNFDTLYSLLGLQPFSSPENKTVESTLPVHHTLMCKAKVDMSPGQFVSITGYDGKNPEIILACADRSLRNPAHGFVVQQSVAKANDLVEICVGAGLNKNISGLIPGKTYYLSRSRGLATDSCPNVFPWKIYLHLYEAPVGPISVDTGYNYINGLVAHFIVGGVVLPEVVTGFNEMVRRDYQDTDTIRVLNQPLGYALTPNLFWYIPQLPLPDKAN